MKVNGIENIIEFKKLSELSPGDTFLYELEVYMVTNSVNYIPSIKTNNIVVVDLNSGRIHQFSNDTQVIPIKVEANIQSKDLQAPIYSIYGSDTKQWGIGAKQRNGGDAI